MKKNIIIVLILFLSFFTVNVDAAEVEITEENAYLLQDLLFETRPYFSENKDKYPYFLIFKTNVNDFMHLTVSSEKFYRNSSNLIVFSGMHSSFYFQDKVLHDTGMDTVYAKKILFSNVDILNQDGTVFFEKNYPVEVEPTPTPTPTPTASPIPDNPDTSELEKCDSFICDITDSILVGFNLEEFPFVRTVIYYLLCLVVLFACLSPFIILFKLVRWFK